MPTSMPSLDGFKALKSAQWDKEAIQRNHPHYKNATQTSKKDDSEKKAATVSGTTSEAKRGGDPTTPLGKRAAKRTATTAAAAQKASAQAGSMTQPKTGNASAPPSVAKSFPSSPSKGKSGRGSKHQPKPPSTSPGQIALTAPSSSIPPRTPVPRLCPHPHLPLRLRVLTVLEDGRSLCFDSHQGSSRQP